MIIRKPILQTPSRHTPRRLATPKSVRIQSEVVSDMTTPDSDPTQGEHLLWCMVGLGQRHLLWKELP